MNNICVGICLSYSNVSIVPTWR